MSVLPTATAAMQTPSVRILWDHTTVPANLDSMEMEENVLVTMEKIYLFIALKNQRYP